MQGGGWGRPGTPVPDLVGLQQSRHIKTCVSVCAAFAWVPSAGKKGPIPLAYGVPWVPFSSATGVVTERHGNVVLTVTECCGMFVTHRYAGWN